MIKDEAKPAIGEIQEELQRILSSNVFATSQRSRDFLRYVVEKSVLGSDSAPKEYAIAVDVFGRDDSYDPSIDATVRVEAGRLRSRLRDYYSGEGSDDPVCIDIPKGGYAPIFLWRTSKPEAGQRQFPAIDGAPGPETAGVTPKEISSRGALPNGTELNGIKLNGIKLNGASLNGGQLAGAGSTSVSVRVLLVAIVVVTTTLIALGVRMWRGRESQAAAKPGDHQQISLAVLPFTNETGDSSKNYLADGLTENLIRELSGIPRLKVMARGAVYRFRSSTDNAVAIGRSLGVSTVLTGSMRQAEGKLTIDTELSNVRDGSVIESHQYLPEGQDLRPVQASILQDLIRGLRIDLDARQSAHTLRPVSSSPEAYQEFLQGESASRGNSPIALHQAIDHFEKAVRIDPAFALAWADLAEAHLELGVYFEDPRQDMPQASKYALHALQLDDSLREAHGTLGLVQLLYNWDYAAAVSQLSSAENEQSAITVLSCTSHLLMQTGRTRDADELVHRMLDYDPQSASLIGELGCIDYYRANYSEAVRHFREAMADDPHSPVPYWGVGKSLSLQGKYGEAVQLMRQFKMANGFEPPLLTAEIGYALARGGKEREARVEIDDLRKESKATFVDPYMVALIYLGMRNEPLALQWLDRAYVVRSPFLISISTEPKWKEMKERPRLQAFLEKLTPQKNTPL